MNGVGTGTIIDHVQAHRGNDDHFEWFGGTVKAKFLVATGGQDDQFDWQIGWRGGLQFALGHAEGTIFDTNGSNGIEADNNELGFDNQPRSNPKVCNVTSIGAKGVSTITGSGANLRRGTSGTVSNSIFTNWLSDCLDIDNNETLARGCTNATTLRTGADTLLVQDTICFSNDTAPSSQVSGTNAAAACTPAQLYGLWAATEGLVPADPTTAGPDPMIPSAAAFPGPGGFATADYRPTAPLAAPDCEALDPAFFDSAPYIGAFQSGGTNWLLDSAACPSGQVADCWLSSDLN
jgi:hypothetical protein